ncbi:hypothetical protein GSM42_16215 [Shimazuella sp. KC615]|uniref:Uncharacterized protein n=1 Tax=Shimazuella alba TaxID=2690964 RepID=A0A6I4VTX0_9BACL|nr:histidine phosphatase family protein [Shimazuella alba]MXQ55229.1 hypothetical protein [Shimazuella alba]
MKGLIFVGYQSLYSKTWTNVLECRRANTGRLDSPLTDAGVHQAQQLARQLQNISFDSIYSSSSNRAFSTALYLRKNQEKVINHLMEMDFATWQGRKWTSIIPKGNTADEWTPKTF